MTRRVRRTLGLLAIVALAASGFVRGLCFMPGTGEAAARDAHACCKKGWTARPPECCMASVADEDPARGVATTTLGAPVLAATAALLPALPAAAQVVLRTPDRSHSPPGHHPLRV